MEKILKSKLVTCILILVLASSIFVFAGDVIVKEGGLTVDGDLMVEGDIGDYDNRPYTAYFTHLYVASYAHFTYDVYIGTLTVYGKINAHGLIDPPGVLYDQQTRQEIIDCAKRAVAPDKQDGALVFFNKDTKRLETYIQSEGKFYDLQGNLIHTLPAIEVATNYKTLYYFDRATGDVKAAQRTVYDKYRIKKGFRLDRETGHFINRASGDIVPKEVAVEFQKGS